MVFSRYIWTIVGLVLAILFTSIGFGIFLQRPQFPVTSSLLLILLATETLFLIFYLFRTRRDLLKLVIALRNADPTIQFTKEEGDPYFGEIHRGFNEIIRNFRLVRLDKEVEHQFFKATVDHIQFGIIAFNQQEKIEMVNDGFLKLFQLDHLTSLDSLTGVSVELPDLFRQLTHHKELLKQVTIGSSIHHLLFMTSSFKLQQQEIKLISVRDISREIDQNELEAWQKLLRVLRHEILNSISPIKLLAANLMGMITHEGEWVPMGTLTKSETEDMKTGLETIHRRATGLSNFLDAYSNLYRIPELELKYVKVKELLERVVNLFSEQFTTDSISHQIHCEDSGLSIEIDERLIEQVLINLVRNSVDAVFQKNNPSIDLFVKSKGQSHVIGVKDSGNGIPVDQLESIFIPFYSTKEGGQGIGLSFSQHVMRLHNGQLKVNTTPGKGSEFQLVFLES